MHQTIKLSPVASHDSIIGKGKIVAFNVGPDRVVYLVIATRPLDDRFEQPGGASFVKTKPDHPQRYRLIGLYDGELVNDLMIEGERFNIHEVQPLGDRWLLACARSLYRSSKDFEKNGRIYSGDGRFKREILLGDGIASMQATSEGVIWIGYFDEGVFGNYGWSTPVGASGLVAWRSNGEKIWEFQPSGDLDPIYDCYAMNVATARDVWFYYYNAFPLVWLHDYKVAGVWHMPLAGSRAFAVFAGHALFYGGYDDSETFHLYSLEKNGDAELLAQFDLQNENGQKIEADRIVGRGDTIYLIQNRDLFQIDVEKALANLGQG